MAGRRISRWIVANNFGDEGKIYWGSRAIAYRANNGQTFFEHQDILGTERARTNYQGQLALTSSSLSFGDGFSKNLLLSTGDQDIAYFTGIDKDLESSTDHATFRQYSSILGRWMSPDPYNGSYDANNPQSLNRYSYVLNNPHSLVDPLGLDDSYACVDGDDFVSCDYGGDDNGDDGSGGASGGNAGSGGGSGGGGGGGGQAPSNPACAPTGSLPSSVGLSYGGNADIGGGPNAGFTSTAGAGAGFFHDSNSSSLGAFASGGATGYFGPAYAGTPSQQGQPFSFGAYAGVGPSVWFSNAHTAQQLAGPFTTYNFNAGGGLLKGLSLQLSVGGGIWQLSVGLPIPYTGASTPSLAFSKLTTTTAATHGGCKG